MLKFRDFAPPQQELGLLGEPEIANLAEAVEAANQWIDTFHIDVVTVETVVLPNLDGADATTAGELKADAEDARWFQVVRIWYRDFEDPATEDEIRVFPDEID